VSRIARGVIAVRVRVREPGAACRDHRQHGVRASVVVVRSPVSSNSADACRSASKMKGASNVSHLFWRKDECRGVVRVNLELGSAFWLQFAEPCHPRHVEIARTARSGAVRKNVRPCGRRYQIAHRATTPHRSRPASIRSTAPRRVATSAGGIADSVPRQALDLYGAMRGLDTDLGTRSPQILSLATKPTRTGRRRRAAASCGPTTDAGEDVLAPRPSCASPVATQVTPYHARARSCTRASSRCAAGSEWRAGPCSDIGPERNGNTVEPPVDHGCPTGGSPDREVDDVDVCSSPSTISIVTAPLRHRSARGSSRFGAASAQHRVRTRYTAPTSRGQPPGPQIARRRAENGCATQIDVVPGCSTTP